MEGGQTQPIVNKPTGANKRKGANPVKQIINSDTPSEAVVLTAGSPLDLTVRQEEEREQRARKVILSVPKYKSVTTSSASSPTSSSSSLSDSPIQPELSVTPVIKKEILNDQDDLDFKSDLISNNNFALHTLLNNQTQALFSLEHLKQASLIFQKHARNPANPAIGFKAEFLQTQQQQLHGGTQQQTNNNNNVWNNLVTSTVTSSESTCDDKRKIHKCDFPTCDKVYTKSSHLKAHKRKLSSHHPLSPLLSLNPIQSNKFLDKIGNFHLIFTLKLLLFCTSSNLLIVDIFLVSALDFILIKNFFSFPKL